MRPEHCLLPLMALAVAAGNGSCRRTKPPVAPIIVPVQAAQMETTEKAAVQPVLRAYLITATGIGPVQLGMTIQEARTALPEAKWVRTSNGEGAALVDVRFGREAVMTLFAGEEDPDKPVDWARKITSIESFSSAYSTAAGVRVGTLVLDAEKAYGPTQSVIRSEVESREYITFKGQPEHLTFRIDDSGDFPEGSRTTTRVAPQGKIFSITISAHG